MSNYVKSTNFATKDTLSAGDVNKIVKGTEIDTEFNNIATAVSTKADLASPTFTGSPVLPTGTTGVTQSSTDDTTKLATTAFVQDVADAVKAALYPVGSIYCNATSSTNPGTLLGFGTWTAFGAGRVMVGLDAGNTAFDTAEETGGSANATLPTHTHTLTDPGHLHTTTGVVNGTVPGGVVTVGVEPAASNTTYNTGSAFTGITIASTGASATNANLQPYIVVYMWKRVS